MMTFTMSELPVVGTEWSRNLRRLGGWGLALNSGFGIFSGMGIYSTYATPYDDGAF